MKKTILGLKVLLSLVLLMSLVACGNKKENTLYGTWVNANLEITFNQNGTFTANLEPKEGIFKLDGDTMTVYSQYPDEEEMDEYSFGFKYDSQADTLTLYFDETGDVFTRKK